MFCKNCGNQTKENSAFCTECGNIAEETVTPQNVSTQPEYQVEQQDINTNVLTTKKKGKGKLIGIIAACVIVVVIGIIFVMCGSKTEKSSTSSGTAEPNCFVKIAGKSYCMSYGGNLSYLESGEPVFTTDDEVVVATPERSVIKGNSIYTVCGDDDSGLYKFTFKDNGKVEKSLWVSSEKLEKSIGDYDGVVRSAHNWILKENYVYFSHLPSLDFLATTADSAYYLCRISLDGKTVERIGEQGFTTFAIDGDWVYYYNNGHRYEEGRIAPYADPDPDDIGIFKMKLDGSEKTLLYRENDFFIIGTAASTPCCEMVPYGDYIYMTADFDGDGEYSLYRFKKNGTVFEKLKDKVEMRYTIDEENAELYYMTYSSRVDIQRNLIKLDMNNLETTEVCSWRGNTPLISYHENKIYILPVRTGQFGMTISSSESYPAKIAVYYDLTTKKFNILEGYYKIPATTTRDEMGFFVVTEAKDPVYNWVEYEEFSY